jgi:hypothetical protein
MYVYVCLLPTLVKILRSLNIKHNLGNYVVYIIYLANNVKINLAHNPLGRGWCAHVLRIDLVSKRISMYVRPST